MKNTDKDTFRPPTVLEKLNQTLMNQIEEVKKSDGTDKALSNKTQMLCELSKQVIAIHQVSLNAHRLQILQVKAIGAEESVVIDPNLLRVGNG